MSTDSVQSARVRTQDEDTPLHWGAASGDESVVRTLVEVCVLFGFLVVLVCVRSHHNHVLSPSARCRESM
jgi:hypothetical protein